MVYFSLCSLYLKFVEFLGSVGFIFTKFGKNEGIVSLNIQCVCVRIHMSTWICLFSFWKSSYMYIKFLDVVLKLIERFIGGFVVVVFFDFE